MKKESKRFLICGMVLLALYVLWTVCIRYVDVRPIGPLSTSVGFSTLNGWFHSLTGVHMWLYNVTDWLGLVPLAFAIGFAILGLIQFISRRSFLKVDSSILILGGFYLAVIAVFVIFEFISPNYRPVLINGRLEVSYPSSTTMLVMCVMPTAVMQFNSRIKHTSLRRIVSSLLIAFTVFMVVGRLVCGVHWLSDIVGGALYSTGIVLVYKFFVDITDIK